MCPRAEGDVHSRGWDHDRGPAAAVKCSAQPVSHAVLFTDRILAAHRIVRLRVVSAIHSRARSREGRAVFHTGNLPHGAPHPITLTDREMASHRRPACSSKRD